MTPLPHVKSWIIADQVFQQAGSGKWCIIGVFDQIHCLKFPASHPSLGLWLHLADALGEYAIRLELLDENEQVIARLPAAIRLTVEDRMQPVYVGLQTQNMLLPRPGTYFLRVFCNEQPLPETAHFRASKVQV